MPLTMPLEWALAPPPPPPLPLPLGAWMAYLLILSCVNLIVGLLLAVYR